MADPKGKLDDIFDNAKDKLNEYKGRAKQKAQDDKKKEEEGSWLDDYMTDDSF